MTREAYVLVLYNFKNEVIFSDVWYATRGKGRTFYVDTILNSLFPPYAGAYEDFPNDIKELMKNVYSLSILKVSEETANEIYSKFNNPTMNINYVASKKDDIMISALLDYEYHQGNLEEVYYTEATKFSLGS